MLISVIIPNYNRIAQLKRAVESVRQQKDSQWELIVVDDCSTAAIYTEITRYIGSLCDSRITLLRHEKNENGAAARNTGIRAAKGEYIAFLDSDDEWMADKLGSDRAGIMATKAKLIYSPIVNCTENTKSSPFPISGIRCNETIGDYLFYRNKNGRGMQTSTLVVDSALAKECLFNPELKGHQDWDFLLRLSTRKPSVAFVKECQTRRHLDENGAHVHKALDLEFSTQFLTEYKGYLSNKAIKYFVIRILLPKAAAEHRPLTLLTLWWNYRLGGADGFFVCKQLAKSLLFWIRSKIL